jgi:isopenicillin-N epimerase
MNERYQPTPALPLPATSSSTKTETPPSFRCDPSDDAQWEDITSDFLVAPGTIYLNHGSFGIPACKTRYAQRAWSYQHHENPMDFFLYQAEPLFADARAKLAMFLGAAPENLALVDNATYAMSIVAASFPLNADDEVLITDHEYVPVTRMWQARCDQVGAKLVVARLPDRIESDEEIVNSLTSHINDHTKLLVISHITSPTALILPLEYICRIFSSAQIPICIDGPHAPAQIELNIEQLRCDFYAASCHKWLSAPLGTGFLYVHPKWQSRMVPLVKGWGRLPPAEVSQWSDQFFWTGTRDISHFLSIPTAIEYLNGVGFAEFRARCRWLAEYIENALCQLFQTEPIGKRSSGFYGSMAHVPLPPGDWSQLQLLLKNDLGIEVVVNQFGGRWFLRVSCHLYNNMRQLDLLVKTLAAHRIAGQVPR